MKMDVPAAVEEPAQAAQRLADKQESEFNHHLAGLFVICAGIFILAESHLARVGLLCDLPGPCAFLAAGLFVSGL